jgi:hypothetical protein
LLSLGEFDLLFDLEFAFWSRAPGAFAPAAALESAAWNVFFWA